MEYKNCIDCSIGNASTFDLQDMKSVKEVCDELGITRKTLFYYDKVGLLKPSYREGSQKHKYYNPKAIERLSTIRLLRSVGMKIEEIKEYLEANSKRRKELLKIVEERNREEIKILNKQIKDIKKLIERE